MRIFLLALVSGYQRFLSPYKGFCCAFRARTGAASCSALGYRAIRMHGTTRGLAILRERLFLCGVAHRRRCRKQRRPPLAQRGDCDIGCADLPFDGHCGGGHGHLCDFADCPGGQSCDWSSGPKKRKRKGKPEADIHLPRYATPHDER